MFTEIEFMEQVPEHMLQPEVSADEFTWYEAQEVAGKTESQTPENAWAITNLPDGFNSDMQRRHNMPNKTAVRHMVFSDGLASVSVFIEKHKTDAANITGASRMGAVNAYGRKLNSHHVTVVGEVPSATVRLIGESVIHKIK